MKVAIVCDWLTGLGGAERVVLELHKMFPEAPIYTSQYDPVDAPWFKDADVRTTWLQKLPKGLKKFLPVLRAWSFSRLGLSAYDLVISASGAEAKSVKTGPKTIHICYCYAPTHYYWSRYNEYTKNPGFGKLDWLARLGLRVLVGPMRRWDKKAAQRPDYMIGISSHIQAEIKRYYGRDSELVFPPVDIERFKLNTTDERDGFVIAGRQTPYKRFDLVVSACSELGLKLTVIGAGPDHQKLKKLAGPTATFLTGVSDDAMPEYFANAEAFVFPGLDDFGITPVEALACGTPVIAYKAGGALDYVHSGKNGLFFDEQTAKSLKAILKEFSNYKFDPKQVSSSAQNFNAERFHQEMRKTIDKLIKNNSTN